MDTDEFDRRLGQPLQHLRGVLVARHGSEVGLDVHAEVAVVVHAYGYTYEEAAEVLGISPASVRNRLHRGMTKLRRLLHEKPSHADR